MSISPGGADKPAASVKLVLLGEAAVGKSSLVLRFVSNDFQENKEPTIGAAFLTQKCQLPNRTVKFEIWDTAGQERFASLAPMYYRNAQAALVVYDVTKPSSFIKARHWVSELHAQASPGIVIALVGNKVDLCLPDDEDDDDGEATSHDDSNNENEQEGHVSSSSVDARKVSKQEGRQLAQEENLLFYETSAKTSLNVQQVFMDIANHLPEQSLTSRRGGGGSGGGRRSGAGGAGGSGSTGGRDEPLDLTARNSQSSKSSCGC